MAFKGDYEHATVADLTTALARRDVSARELCELAIARIEQHDGAINAVVVRDFERARGAADAADGALARGERAPLLGIPMTVKESFNVAGLPTSWGLTDFRDFHPREDAVAVTRLKRAGAVILGKTNVAPALADWQADNRVYGRTNNPRDLTRTPGGSSGGSAAALAAGFVPLELGSDIAGSIRVPAHFSGVCGHKPSWGLAPQRGHDFPTLEGGETELAVIGPLARSTDDLTRALDVIAGPDSDLAVAYQLRLPPPRRDDLRDLRVLVRDQHPSAATASELRTAIDALARDLEKAGAKVARESTLLPDLAAAHGVYQKLFLTIVGNGRPLPDGSTPSAFQWLELQHARTHFRRAWARFFEAFDVVVSPPFGTVATVHATPSGHRQVEIDGVNVPIADQFAWPGVATLPGLPATAVPIASNRDGLPIGVQVIGPYLEDRTPLMVAGGIEKLRS